ncbi:hypothetical protein RCL_jg18455.t1 [Rhizophagus clarus]|uniref:Uncharacterized protein n=1 Tax=Rhizophagus clarus TaxID=94130 RepID=A0A8H3QNJ7_9GLOM|nr:hypothetical protein RCL_jg18455.t1 [Rhizophagus clarus]
MHSESKSSKLKCHSRHELERVDSQEGEDEEFAENIHVIATAGPPRGVTQVDATIHLNRGNRRLVKSFGNYHLIPS